MSLSLVENVNLSDYTTIRAGGMAKFFVEVKTEEELIEALRLAKQKNLKVFILGGGSNTIFADSAFDGLIMLNRIKLKSGFEIIKEEGSSLIKAGSGETWDDLVQFSVDNNLTGIEALSLIPGTVGAAPVQNIGAYGQQVSDSVLKLKAINIENLQVQEFRAEDCDFGYRKSRFNQQDKGHFIITEVTFKLKSGDYQGKMYRDVQAYFETRDGKILDAYHPGEIRKAVVDIRSNKLPDYTKVANAGSFFKNPIISEDQFNKLESETPGVSEAPVGWTQAPFWQVEGGYKIAAGWLVGQASFQNFYDDDLGWGTWPKQNLVLYSKLDRPNYNNLLKLKAKIIDSVKLKFGIELSQEPEEVL